MDAIGINNIWWLLVLLSIFPITVVILRTKIQFDLRKIFNFSKELKQIKIKNKIPKTVGNENNTLLGITPSKKQIFVNDDIKHIFICGTTGSGKTVCISNFIKTAIDKNYPCLIIDGKGDTNNGSILDTTLKLAKNKKKVYVINLNDPDSSDKYNPFQNTNPSTVKDMLINMSDWSEEHYKLNTERYLQRVANLLNKFNIKLSFNSVIKCIPIEKYTKASSELLKAETITKQEHLENIELANTSGKIAEGANARFSTLLESEIGKIFKKEGIDIYTALKENAVILFVLNPLMYPEISPAFGKLALIDAKKAVSKLYGEGQETRKFFIFDELQSYASNSLLDLVNKSRSAGVTNILATQSLSDLDVISEQFKEQIIENCNNYVVLRQNSAINAENWANILGTRATMEVTYQLQQQGFDTTETGFGSAKRVREFLYHPDDIKLLQTGRGIYLTKDSNYHSKILINKPF